MRKNMMKKFAMTFTVVMLFQGFMGVLNADSHKDLEASVSKLTCCSYISYEDQIEF
jgi:hypothetical protein